VKYWVQREARMLQRPGKMAPWPRLNGNGDQKKQTDRQYFMEQNEPRYVSMMNEREGAVGLWLIQQDSNSAIS
jgi:hypothetical protein